MANKNIQKKYHYIYKTTSLVNGKFYIGMHSTNNLEDGYLGSGKSLRRAIRKYGESNFKLEILEFFSNREELAKREKELVTEDLIQDPTCFNLRPGGEGGYISEEQQRSRSLAAATALRKKKEDPEFLAQYLANQKKGVQKARKEGRIKTPKTFTFEGKKHSEATLELYRQTRKGTGTGNNNSQHGTFWITNGTENKKIKVGTLIPNGYSKGRVL